MSAPTSLREVTRGLSEVARLSVRPDDVDALLRRALDALADAVPYDLAAVLELRGNDLAVRCARGPLAHPKVLRHEFRLEPGSAVERALETRRARVMSHDEHEAGFDPYHGVLDLPDGHGCLVVPLVAADQALGVMTFDRARCESYEPATVELATIYGQLVALAMFAARHAEQLEKDKQRLEEENRLLVEETRADGDAGALLAATLSPAMGRVVGLARQVATTDAPVLITGETGTGKEVLARAIHEWSPRARQPFLQINCAALPESLLESELFGHVKGAFSGAERDRPGRFLVAHGGTLLLDEVGEMPLAAQAKLLRVLQEGTLEPLGSDLSVQVNVRVVAATHVDLVQAIREGCFREDLYYRLGLFPLELPPLRQRAEDLIPLSERFLAGLAARTGRGPWRLGSVARARIEQHTFPGNVRELINALERATILCPSGVIDEAVVLGPGGARASDAQPEAGFGPPFPTLAELETAYLQEVLQHTGGKIYGPDGAASVIGLKPTTLQSRLAKRGLSRKGVKAREGVVDTEGSH